MSETRYKMALEAIAEIVTADTNNNYTVLASQCKSIAKKALETKPDDLKHAEKS